MTTSRRQFLKGSLWAGAVWTASSPNLVLSAATRSPRYRAAVIGHTGAGDYGHGYDRIFNDVENVTVVAVADPDPSGREQAAERSRAPRQYADYRELLRKEKPDLVSIAMRHPGQHRDIALAAVEVCQGIFSEKPFTETVAEADEVLDAAARRNVKIQMAHNRRYSRGFVVLRALLAEGFVGTVRQVNIHGKQDTRAGGEDLMVLGTHDFDLMRYYFGDPRWCSATVRVQGRDAATNDVRPGREPIRVAGDTIHATFGFPGNLVAHWGSVTTRDDWNTRTLKKERWSFEILGTRRIVAYQSGAGFGYLDSPFLLQRETDVLWQPLPDPQNWVWPEHARHPIRSLIHAIQTDGEPICSGADGRWAIEMVAAVYESHRRRARVALPLQNREDPLEEF
jgi:predicted dehydrogenase